MAAAVMLGAEGVLMGTRFYASVEADGHPEAKRRIVAVEYTAARARGDFDMAGVIAGEACGLIHDILRRQLRL